MNSDRFDWDAYVDSMAALHGLVLDAQRRSEVSTQLQRIEALARQFVDFPLGPEVDPAPVFRP